MVLELTVLELVVLEVPVLDLPVLEAPVLELPVLELPVLELPILESPALEPVEALLVQQSVVGVLIRSWSLSGSCSLLRPKQLIERLILLT